MPSKIKGKGGKKHRRAKNIVATDFVELTDEDQFFWYCNQDFR